MSAPDASAQQRQLLLREAAHWLLRLDEGDLSTAEQSALRIWCRSSPEHERVWQAACELNQDLCRLPAAIARPVLQRSRASRRTMLKAFLGAGVTLPLGWLATEHKTWQPLLADYRTAVGELRTLNLSDGTRLTMNTATALDVKFSGNARQIHLFEGEIFIQTGEDQNLDKLARPFSVVTAQGAIQALGTEFATRCLQGATQVGVAKDTVKIIPHLSPNSALMVHQGERCRFTDTTINLAGGVSKNDFAWQRGQLIVDAMPLRDFLKELSRYRRGVLRCDDAVADVKVSGVFQLGNTEQALDVLSKALHLQVKRYADYWVLLHAA